MLISLEKKSIHLFYKNDNNEENDWVILEYTKLCGKYYKKYEQACILK